MKLLLEALSQVFLMLRSSSIKFPGKVLILIKYLGLLLDILKQWFYANQTTAKSPKVKRFVFR
ncbi:hypothetical protein [Sphingobacterium mizutaii]|uniref:hypothetical protein n=1 Tax=Sphingobacterium mizutaii TaxID=1010 RepID=UPI00289F8279|nr:hypothetical protein [Sphingobacterium mizutaii]